MQSAAQTSEATPQSVSEQLIGVEHGALFALAEQLPNVNRLLETSFEEISGTFMQVAGLVSQYRAQTEALEMPETARSSLAALSQDINSNISKIVMGMQFQDRVSQNLVITINVLNDLLADRTQAGSDQADAASFAKSVLEKMKLGEFRQRYLDYLLTHGLIDNAFATNYQNVDAENIAAASTDDDIDLF